MNETGWVNVALSGLTLLGIIINAWINWKREGRDREWKLEDEYRKERIHQELTHNTAVTEETKADAQKAFKEANSVNKKLEDSTNLTKQVVEKVLNRSPEMRTRAGDLRQHSENE